MTEYTEGVTPNPAAIGHKPGLGRNDPRCLIRLRSIVSPVLNHFIVQPLEAPPIIAPVWPRAVESDERCAHETPPTLPPRFGSMTTEKSEPELFAIFRNMRERYAHLVDFDDERFSYMP